MLFITRAPCEIDLHLVEPERVGILRVVRGHGVVAIQHIRAEGIPLILREFGNHLKAGDDVSTPPLPSALLNQD